MWFINTFMPRTVLGAWVPSVNKTDQNLTPSWGSVASLEMTPLCMLEQNVTSRVFGALVLHMTIKSGLLFLLLISCISLLIFLPAYYISF